MLSSKQIFNQITNALSSIYDAEEARSIAFILLEHTFHLSKTAILADKPLKDIHTGQIVSMIRRLQNHEPVQYVIGETEFMGRVFKVNPSVLIPRPETEELVNIVVAENKPERALKILDIGTGSGCIAISLAASFLQAEVLAMDISEEALQVARTNAEINQVRVQFIQADILDHVPARLLNNTTVDIVVSNPPYVMHAEKPLMRKNVTDFEPHLALFVDDNDALLFYRNIIRFCVQHLQKGGSCYVEINEQFARATENLFLENGFSQATVYTDTFGKERFVKGQF